MVRFLWVCLGGAVGTAARYGISTFALATFGTRLPWGTFIVNVVGSMLIGAIMQFATLNPGFSVTARVALTAGVMGGFTTYSSFNFETTRLLHQGAWRTGALNVGLTLVTCYAAGLLGMRLAEMVVRR